MLVYVSHPKIDVQLLGEALYLQLESLFAYSLLRCSDMLSHYEQKLQL